MVYTPLVYGYLLGVTRYGARFVVLKSKRDVRNEQIARTSHTSLLRLVE